jgi:hypothetical protein
MPTLRDLYLIDARFAYLEQILAALGLGPGGYAGLRRASSTRLCATTADQM